MKRSDLFRRYAEVIDMCEGVNITSGECVKYEGIPMYGTLKLNRDIDQYEFALAIIEDRPVFAGDVLYTETNYRMPVRYVVSSITPNHLANGVTLTWTKPDPFAELKQAKAEGKRVVFFDGAKWIDTDSIDTVNFKPGSYKVAEADEGTITGVLNPFGCTYTVRVKWHKCGITGKITAEVIE